MTPERRDEYGIVHFWDKELGVPESGYWSGAHFVDPSKYRRVQLNWEGVWNNGKLGTWVGWDDPIIEFPRFELVVWDGKCKGVTGIHTSRINFLDNKK